MLSTIKDPFTIAQIKEALGKGLDYHGKSRDIAYQFGVTQADVGLVKQNRQANIVGVPVGAEALQRNIDAMTAFLVKSGMTKAEAKLALRHAKGEE